MSCYKTVSDEVITNPILKEMIYSVLNREGTILSLKGDTGTPGLQGLQGPIGPVGTQGPIGLDGAQGMQGPIGITGPQGIPGTQGTQGIPGTQGTQGIPGTQGTQGDSGVSVDTNGHYYFSVINGDLFINYGDLNNPPDFTIDNNGDLIFTM